MEKKIYLRCMFKARKLLYPFSLLYSGVMLLRNKLYDEEVFSSEKFDLPVIAVGNLSVGGTGKSPMVESLIALLKEDLKVATLSRGYKRKSSGFLLLTGQETAAEAGDEPLQFKNKFPEVMVAVDESRSHGIGKLLKNPAAPDVIVLDDAFQHRKVAAGLYILLTPFGNLYTEDMVLPAGNLREPKLGAKRADIIVVTKCPNNLSLTKQEEIKNRIAPKERQRVFFSRIAYSDRIFGKNSFFPLQDLQKRNFTLVTGIANPKPLVKYLKAHHLKFEHLRFPDHHNFNSKDLKELGSKELILTTEKDYMRLKNDILGDNLLYLPITSKIIGNEKDFNNLVLNFAHKK
jgi:tetraacyldisaccharide 4'-kinase